MKAESEEGKEQEYVWQLSDRERDIIAGLGKEA